MRGEPLHIITEGGRIPAPANKPIPVPLHWKREVLSDLERDVALGVIERVPVNTPVTFCARMVVVPKHDGRPRRTVDLQKLNSISVRQTHHTRSPFMVASGVPANTKKSVLDVWNSYHSVPVREEDQHKLTFVTEWGRFRYKVAPQGYLASGDGFTQRFGEVTRAIPNHDTVVDDTVLWSTDERESFDDVCRMITLCGRAGLIFNSEKFQFASDTVDFAGLEITSTGVRPSKKILESILQFPAPANISEVRSFFGLVNQVNYAFASSETMEPFRHLLKPGTPYRWSPLLEKKFMEAKEMIVKCVEEGVKHFEVGRPTCLATDWSKQGLGFFLLQKWCNCVERKPGCCRDGWKLVLAGGRFTSPSESRYSPVEGECLAVADALNKAKHFVLGCPDLLVAVDHKPLLGVLNDKPLEEIENPRLLALKQKTLWYRFDMVHVPGKSHYGPDYMSRQGQGVESTREARVNCIMAIATAKGRLGFEDVADSYGDQPHIARLEAAINFVRGIHAVTFERVKQVVERDEEMKQLREAVENLDYNERFPEGVAVYDKYKRELTVLDGVPMMGTRVVIPTELRQEILDALHSAHQCPVGMLSRAKQAVFWPGMTKAIEERRQACRACNETAPSQAALPPHPLASPDYPFQMVVADYGAVKSKSWLIMADRFTGWISLYYFPAEATASKLVEILRNQFTTFGIPDDMTADGGSQFTAGEVRQFLARWGCKLRTSSAYNPHGNLRAESAVKSAKRMLMEHTGPDGSPRWEEINRALMQHRNSPVRDINLSPAQLLFGRPIRDFLPIRPDLYKPSEVWVDCREKRELALRHRTSLGGERWAQHTRDLPSLELGEHVFIQNQKATGKMAKRWDRTGVIVENMGFDKYLVRVDGSGRTTQRNRRFLRQFKPATTAQIPMSMGRPGGPDYSFSTPIQTSTPDATTTTTPATPTTTFYGSPATSPRHQLTPDTGTPLARPGREGFRRRVLEEVEEGEGPMLQAQEPVTPFEEEPVVVEGRGLRNRKPNTRYSSEEYDLTQD